MRCRQRLHDGGNIYVGRNAGGSGMSHLNPDFSSIFTFFIIFVCKYRVSVCVNCRFLWIVWLMCTGTVPGSRYKICSYRVLVTLCNTVHCILYP
jgi:hypothetical protein